MRSARREKVFGSGHAVPLDRNAKIRIQAYARSWSARHRQPGQHHGPITIAFERVLGALLWSFHNSRDGRCFPGYERIAQQARCARSTVAEALRVLEFAKVLSWQNRIIRAVVRQRDLFGRWSNRSTVIRTSNAYVFHDPQPQFAGVRIAKSDFRGGTSDQEYLDLIHAPARDLHSPLECALARFGEAIDRTRPSQQAPG
jgi:hypothetical protein